MLNGLMLVLWFAGIPVLAIAGLVYCIVVCFLRVPLIRKFLLIGIALVTFGLAFFITQYGVYYFCYRPLTTTPICKPDPVLAIKLPKKIATLAGLFHGSHDVEEESYDVGGPDNIRETYTLRQNVKPGVVEYRFELYNDEQSAISSYDFWNKLDDDSPIFRKERFATGEYSLHFTHQLRTDPEGGCEPTAEYRTEIIFRIQNLVISVRAEDRAPNTQTLQQGIDNLAEMLKTKLAQE